MNIQPRVRRLMLAGSLCLVTACGGVGYVAGAPVAGTRATPAATPAEHAPTLNPASTAKTAPEPAPVPPTPGSASITFAINALFPDGARGSVTATVSADGVHYHVVVRNLIPGSTHTIHDHLGSCDAANRSRHLAVLDTSRADKAGTIVFDTSVPTSDFGTGRIVIVYDSASPLLITGCATL